MDKIINFMNIKTNGKFNDLLFFGAVYYSKTDTMQLEFRYSGPTDFSKEKDQIEVLCKLYFGELVSEINVNVVKHVLSMDELEKKVNSILSNSNELEGQVFHNIKINFDSDKPKVICSYDYLSIKEDLSSIKSNFETLIKEETGFVVEIVFSKEVMQSDNFLEEREKRISEDGRIVEELLKAQYAQVLNINSVYGEVNCSSALLAGNFTDEVVNVNFVGTLKSFEIKEFTPKTKKNEEDKNTIDNGQENSNEKNDENKKKFLSFSLENEQKEVRCSFFLPKNIKEIIPLEIGKSVVVNGSVNIFHNIRTIRAKAIAYCDYIPPKVVWRDCPSSYRVVFPEQYEFTVQTNFLESAETIKCKDLLNNSYVVYDLETTGISPETCKIIDIGAYKIVNGKIVDKFCTFVNPCEPIPDEASSINHITDNMVKDSPTIREVLPDFYKYCYGSIIVGYNNIGFDDVFINKAGKQEMYNFDNKREDAFVIAKTKLFGLKNYKLGTVCDYMGVPLIDAHRAANDALATAKLFIKLKEKFY